MDLVHFQLDWLLMFALSSLCSSFIYHVDPVDDLESFVPMDEEDPLELRFPRDIPRDVASGSLKRLTSQFNDELPASLVEIGINNSYGNPVNSTLFEEHHIYYNVTFLPNATMSRNYYVKLDNDTCNHHEGLSRAHLKAAGIPLSFNFPFYGHKLSNLTLATGGFLYTGNPDHSWIAATQYIAPLMADFAFDLRNDSDILYCDNGTAVTFEWRNAVLQEKPQVGPFTFQVTLKDDGTIIFYYVKLPVAVTSIPNDTHPVKVGVSDAYMIDRQRFIIRYRTIYEYHRISLNLGNITDGSAMVLEALPTCISMESCDACLNANISGCMWCPTLKRCSDGLDRFHQEWHTAGCPGTASNRTCAPFSFPVSFIPSGNSTLGKTVRPTSSRTDTTGSLTAAGASSQRPVVANGTPVSNYSTGPARSRQVSSPDPNSIPGIGKSKYTFVQGNDSAGDLGASSRKVTKSEPYVAAQNQNIVPMSTTTTNYGVAVAAVMSVAIIGCVLAWMVYAYLRPHTTSGQWLIKYRPNQWRREREDEIQIANTAL